MYKVSRPYTGYYVGNSDNSDKLPEAICYCHFVVAMAIVVMGGMCVQSIMAIPTTISNL